MRSGSSSLRPQCTRAGLRLLSVSRLAVPQLRADGWLWPGRLAPAGALRPPGHRFVSGFVRPCSPLRLPPLTVPLGPDGHFWLFAEGRRELGREFSSAPCHLSQACWELPPRPKATSHDWIASAKEDSVRCLTGCREVGNKTNDSNVIIFF